MFTIFCSAIPFQPFEKDLINIWHCFEKCNREYVLWCSNIMKRLVHDGRTQAHEGSDASKLAGIDKWLHITNHFAPFQRLIPSFRTLNLRYKILSQTMQLRSSCQP